MFTLIPLSQPNPEPTKSEVTTSLDGMASSGLERALHPGVSPLFFSNEGFTLPSFTFPVPLVSIIQHVYQDQDIYDLPQIQENPSHTTLGAFRYTTLTCSKPELIDSIYIELDLIDPPKVEPFLENTIRMGGPVLEGVSMPNVKLYVPEAFIATPNFYIEDI